MLQKQHPGLRLPSLPLWPLVFLMARFRRRLDLELLSSHLATLLSLSVQSLGVDKVGDNCVLTS